MATPGQLLREARLRHGVSQRRLAIRAGTKQSAISRIERDHVSPTFETLRTLLRLVGEELDVRTKPINHGHDLTLLRRNLSMTPQERVEHGIEFSNFALRNRGVARGR